MRRRLSFALPVLVLLVLCAAPPSAQASADAPTDNPVATYYDGPEGYPAWTDQIAWSRVIDMATFEGGKTDFEKFENR